MIRHYEADPNGTIKPAFTPKQIDGCLSIQAISMTSAFMTCLYSNFRLSGIHPNTLANILRRILIHVSALNLGFRMRSSFNIGTPRVLQGHGFAFFSTVYHKITGLFVDIWTGDFFLSLYQLMPIMVRMRSSVPDDDLR